MTVCYSIPQDCIITRERLENVVSPYIMSTYIIMYIILLVVLINDAAAA